MSEENFEKISLELVIDGEIDTEVDLIANPVEHYETDFPARETVHHVASGFYLDQWGLAPGHLSLSVIVVLDQSTEDCIQKLRRIQTKSKKLGPDDIAEREVNFHYFSRGDHFKITIGVPKFSHGVDRGPNIVIVSLDAIILEDLNPEDSDIMTMDGRSF